MSHRINCTLTVTVLLLSLSIGNAQQPNGSGASLLVNGANGPPWPIRHARAFTGLTSQLLIAGSPMMPVTLVSSTRLATGSLLTPIGIVDIDLGEAVVLFNGGRSTDGGGVLVIEIPVPEDVPTGLVVAFQGVVVDPTADDGASLTAATEVTTALGQVTTTLAMADDNSRSVSLAPHGLSLEFYGTTWDGFFVNSNGSVSFGVGSSDFTASVFEMLSGPPRVALMWSDLSPNNGGTVSWKLDHSGASPLLQVDFTAVPDFGGAGGFHSVAYQHQANIDGAGSELGSISVIHPVHNPPSVYDTVVGISPGGGASAVQTSTDLSQAQAAGTVFGNTNDALFEFFNGIGLGPNQFDLSGSTLTWHQLLPGRYFVQ